jgi:lysophospholipase L1-like esterase
MIESYTGSAVRVVRASDSAAQDIGFNASGAGLDMAAATTFAGGSELSVDIWYDQTGNGNHITQTTAANRPRLRPQNAWRGSQGILFDSFAAASGGTPRDTFLRLPAGMSIDRRAHSAFFTVGLNASYNSNGTLELGTANPPRLVHLSNVNNSGSTVVGGSSTTTTRFPRMNPTVCSMVGRAASYGLSIGPVVTSHAVVSEGLMSGGRVGGSLSGGNFAFRGDWYSVVIYPAALSDTDAGLVRDALQGATATSAYTQTKRIVVDGDSISEGTSSSFLQNNIRQALAFVAEDCHIYNMSVHGTRASIEFPRRVAKQNSIATTGVTKSVTVYGFGSNDLSNSTTGSDLWTTLVLPYIQWAKAQGEDVVVGTVIPRKTSGLIAGFDAQRLIYNDLVRNNAVAEGYTVADYCALPEFDTADDADNLAFYNADKTHPNSAGYALMAGVLGPILTARLA